MKNIPADDANPNLILTLYFLFKSLPALVSAVAIYLGYRLFVMGVTGEASLIVNASGFEGQLINAAPGLVFGVVGLGVLVAVVWKGVEVNLTQKTMNEGGDEFERVFVINEQVEPENEG